MFHTWHSKQKPVFTGFRYGFGRVEVASSGLALIEQPGTYKTKGWWSGTSDRNTFSVTWASDTSVTTSLGLGPNFGSGGGSGWSTTSYGWWYGGYTNNEGSKTDIYRLDYSNDTTNMADRANLSQGRGGSHQGGYNSSFGYVSGGMYGNSGSSVSRVDRYQFATDTSNSVQRMEQAEGRARCHGTGSDHGTYLWFIMWTYGGAGGVTGAKRTYCYRLTYASDSASIADRFDHEGGQGGVASTPDNGWVGPGGGYFNTSNIRRITWASDTSGLTVRAAFPHVNQSWNGSLNNLHIWWWHRTGSQSNLYRMGMSTDVVTAELRAQASVTANKSPSVTSSFSS